MTWVNPNSRPGASNEIAKLLRKSVVGLSLCASVATVAACGRDTTHAEPDPAKVSVDVNPGKPGLNKPLALPRENKGNTKGATIVAEPPSQHGAKVDGKPTAPSADDGALEPASAKPSSASDTQAADLKPSGTSAATLKIKRLVVTTEIEKREPVEVSSFRAKSGPIYAFMELENPGDEDQDVMLTFEHSSGRKVGLVELHIPAKQSRWRTWGRTQNIKQAGEWEAVVRGADGEELARTKFQVSGVKADVEPTADTASAEPKAQAK